MLNKTFAHLHVHTEYSQLDGFGTVKNYVKKAKELGFKFLACTDHGNIDGLLNFQRECNKQGIKPILGCEAYIVPNAAIKPQKEKRGHITLLVKNQNGFESLCRLLTYANLTGARSVYGRTIPRIDYNYLLGCELSDFVIMTACAGSFLHLEGATEFLYKLHQYCDDLYFEIMPHNIEVQKEIHDTIKAYRLLEEYKNIPFIATNDCHYINEDEWKVQEVLLAIQTKAKWDDENRFKFNFKGLHLRTADEMAEAFRKQNHFSRSEYLIAMRNTIKVAKQCCEFRISKQDISLPPIQPDWGPKEHGKELKRLAHEGLDNLGINELQRDEYRPRMEMELELINRKRFARYFLIVLELITWCKKQKIMVGPGRGSVGGSLVAYLTGITKVDPIEYDLLFERFIAEDRIDYPDIDLDFEDIRREEVIQHLEDLYGKYNVSGISTFSKMKARGVIRDVARVFDVPYKEVDEFAKAINITEKQQEDSFVDIASKETDEGRKFKKRYPEVTKLAIKLEGQIRNSGQHAAAVIISADDLRQGDRCNLCIRNDRIMCNWNMEDSEYVGLMKLDILGLNTLTVLNECKRLIKISQNKDIIFEDISLDDKKVFSEINKGNTFGMFQLSAKPTTDLAKEIKIQKFEDIATIIALVRPGPFNSGMTGEYIQRKKKLPKGILWKHKHHIYEEITKDTYGILVYQEQVMKVISEVAGLSYTIADKIRKVIGKKRDPKEFKKYWEMFLKGCLKQRTMDEAEAEEFWDGLQKWASYGFNKAHSIEYALLGYWTGYCKVHYSTEFICAYLSFGTEGSKEDLMNEARNLGRDIIPPKIGISDSHKWIAKNGNLYVPFIEVKGIGDKAAIQCTEKKTIQRRQRGFFDQEEVNPVAKPGSSLDKILKQIGAYTKEGYPKEAQELFSFNLSGDKKDLYPKLHSTLGYSFPDEDLQYYLSLKFKDEHQVSFRNIIKRKRFRNMELLKCTGCELHFQALAPVLPSQGIYNAAIIGEGPGPQENKEGRGFYEKAPAGELLWKEIAKYGYKRSFFHVTNCVKCYPGRKIKTPTKKHIEYCSDWLQEELRKIKCRLILAFGNTCIKAFTDKDSGITDMCGRTEWNEKMGLWICWCLHPASVKHNPGNKPKFEEGIENFIRTLEILKSPK